MLLPVELQRRIPHSRIPDGMKDEESADDLATIEHDKDPPYEATNTIKIGLKIFETINDKFLFPLSLKIMDTPGKLMESIGQQ